MNVDRVCVCAYCGREYVYSGSHSTRKCRACERRIGRKGHAIKSGPPRRGEERKTRVCLKCGRRFPSIGIGNRLCGACNHHNLGVGTAGRTARTQPRGTQRVVLHD